MGAEFLRPVFEAAGAKPAVVWHGDATSYAELLVRIDRIDDRLTAAGVNAGDVVMLRADFSPNAIAAMLALMARGCIVVPITSAAREKAEQYRAIAQGQFTVAIADDDAVSIERLPEVIDEPHALYAALRTGAHAGLVLFSSGSTGASKAVVHDMERLLGKFRSGRRDLRTLAFLLFDHIGGIDTLFYCLSNASTIVVPGERSPEAICREIADRRVEVLPAAPSFLNMLLLSGAHERFDLSSLRVITYGAEVMPESLLARVANAFPGVTLQQKYGASEIGTPRSKSLGADSTFVKIGGDGYEVRVVDGLLEIKAASAMLGYLNAPSPFTADGWFKTGDAVEVQGEYLRVLGRESDMINVGGRKVYPAEVEAVIRVADNVADVSVFGESNAMLGEIVCATIRTIASEDPGAMRARIRRHCAERLETYKVPVRIFPTQDALVSSRFKQLRRREP